MNKRPGQVRVTTEVAFCSFCGRPRTLRREEHQLGTLVRTIVTCETCHRTLSSSIGVASAEPEVAAVPDQAAAPVKEAEAVEVAKPKRAPAKRAAAAKKPATSAKPKTTARQSARKK